MNRKTRNWMLIGFTLVLIFALRWSHVTPREATEYFDLPTPMVIAHQGGNLLNPGDTLHAFDHAMSLGVDVLEMDVHRSQDGHIVVIHDATVERTTNGVGAVRDLTLAQLQSLDAGYHWPFNGDSFPYRGSGIQIPTFDQVLAAYPGMRINVELKQQQPSIVDDVCLLLKKHTRTSLTLVASFHDSVLDEFRHECPGVATSAGPTDVMWFVGYNYLRMAKMFTSPALALQLKKESSGVTLLDGSLVKSAKQWGLAVDYWTLNNVADMRAAINAGASGIITDRPDLLLTELGRL